MDSHVLSGGAVTLGAPLADLEAGAVIPATTANRHYRALLDAVGRGEAEIAEAPAPGRADINAVRNGIEFGVFTDSHGHRYDVDRDSRARITGAVTMAAANQAAIPEGFEWTDADNIQRPHTAATLIALAGEILAWTSAVHAHAVGLKEAAARGENPDITTGWPGQQ